MDQDESEPLTRTDIVDADFGSKLRGVDPSEVRTHLERVADTVEELRAEIARLEAEEPSDEHDDVTDEASDVDDPDDAEPTVAALDLDDDELRARLDDEAQRLIDDAHQTRLAMLEAAEADAAAIREQAEQVYAERSAEADALVEQRRQESTDVGAAELARAQAEAEHLVNEAQVVRRQILEDLARRRTSARRQIEQLRAGRERLLASHDVVRRALEEVTAELGISMSEARAAAETAGYGVPPSSADDIETEIETARLSGLLEPGPAAAELDTADPDEEVGAQPDGDTRLDAAQEAAPETPPVEPEAPADHVHDADDTESSGDLAAVVDLDSARPEVDTKSHPAAHKKAPPGVRSIGVGELPGRPAVDDEVHDLFAQIRSSADDDDTTEDGPAHAKPKRRTASGGGDDTVSLAAIERVMGRVLKRELADEQSAVLTALSAGADADLVGLLGLETDQKDRYWTALEPHASDALAASRPGQSPTGPALVALRSHVDALVADLRASVAEVLDDGGPEDDRIPTLRRVYRQTKTTHIGECVAAVTAEARTSDPATR